MRIQSPRTRRTRHSHRPPRQKAEARPGPSPRVHRSEHWPPRGLRSAARREAVRLDHFFLRFSDFPQFLEPLLPTQRRQPRHHWGNSSDHRDASLRRRRAAGRCVLSAKHGGIAEDRVRASPTRGFRVTRGRWKPKRRRQPRFAVALRLLFVGGGNPWRPPP